MTTTIKEHVGHYLGLLTIAALIAIGLMAGSVQIAHGQTAGAGSQSASGSISGADSRSGAGAAAIINFNNPTPAVTTVTGGRNDRVTYAYEGESRARIETVPDVYAPALAGGNPCQASASIGGSVVGFGVSGGTSWSDDDCNVRQEVALIGNMGDKNLAFYHFCTHSDRVRATVKAKGYASCDDVFKVQPLTASSLAACADGTRPDPVSLLCPGDDTSAKGKGVVKYADLVMVDDPAETPRTVARAEIVAITAAKCDRVDDAGFCWKD